MLARHLAHCADCRQFVESTAIVTELLREAPLAAYQHRAVALRRTRVVRGRQIVPVAAALLVAVAASSLFVRGSGQKDHPGFLPTTTQISSTLVSHIGRHDVRLRLPIGQRSAGAEFYG